MQAWMGEPVDIGNDAGALDADVNVTGGSQPVQFGAWRRLQFRCRRQCGRGCDLSLTILAAVTFNTVNGGK